MTIAVAVAVAVLAVLMVPAVILIRNQPGTAVIEYAYAPKCFYLASHLELVT